LNSRWKSVVTTATAAALACALAACSYFRGDSYKTITAQDMTALTDSFPDMAKRQLAQNDQQRKDLIKKVKETFALALAAQAEGIEKTEKFKNLSALQADQAVAEEQFKREAEAPAGAKPFPELKKEDLENYVKSHQADFDAFVKFATEGQKRELSAEELESVKGQWAELKIRAERGRQLGVEKEAGFQTRLRMLRAQALAQLYRQAVEERSKPTPEEIQKQYAEKPDSDPEKLKQKAEDLLKRVRAGEDFAALAKEHSADRLSAEKGGELDFMAKENLVKPYADAAFALQKGQTSDLVKSEFGYHIIQTLERRTRTPEAPKPAASPAGGAASPPPAPVEEVKTRHILISTRDADTALAQMTQKKVQRAIEDAILKYQVTAPDDFLVNVKGTRAPDQQSPIQLPGAGQQGAPPAPAAPKQ
jgi:parvulin-like peptidyl-prolyl isomerase